MRGCKKIIIGLFMLLGLSMPVYAYQSVGGEQACQQCHTDYTSGSDWHTAHSAAANSDCTKCHDAEQKVLTKNCTACHSAQVGAVPASGKDGCGWVSSHKAEGNNTCAGCHTTCQSGDNQTTCPASACLGNTDPRLDTLRKFRDDVLAKSAAGQAIIKAYYGAGDAIVKYLEAHPAIKASAKQMLESITAAIEPIVK